MMTVRGGKPLVFSRTAPVDPGAAYADEQAAIVAKQLDNRPTTWLHIKNTSVVALKVYLDTPPIVPGYTDSVISLAAGEILEGPYEVTNIWIVGNGTFRGIAGLRVP